MGCNMVPTLVTNHIFLHTDVYSSFFRPAVVLNPLVTGSAPLSSLITSDFWGVPLSHTGHHKSYRPLTSLSFKLDWLLSPGSPFQFHLTNLLLHALVTHLFHTLLLSLSLPSSSSTALTAALLFAAHPIHTEAVAGVVGRAELLSALFFILTLLVHRRHGWSVGASLLAAAAFPRCKASQSLASASSLSCWGKQVDLLILANLDYVYDHYYGQDHDHDHNNHTLHSGILYV